MAQTDATRVALRTQTADVPLSQTERMEMQIQLSHLGYAIDAIDGVIGPRTRTAIRGY